MTDTRPWILYTRVSTEDQAQAGVSMDNQLLSCRAYATARGWTVASEVSDPGASAATLKRPGMQAVLTELRAGKVAGVVVWRLDRLTRSMRDLLGLIDLAEEKGVGIVSVTEALDTTNPMGRFVVHLLGAIAQWERETISARVKSAMDHCVTKGYWVGRVVPPGCVVVADGERKRLAKGPGAELLEPAWSWVLAGASLAQVADRLTEAGATRRVYGGKAPGAWSSPAVRNLLLSSQVVGLLVDAATSAAVRHELSSRDNPNRRGKARAPGAKAKDPSILAGLLRCAACGASCVQVTAYGRGGGYRYFRCSAKVKNLCTAKDVRCEPVEEEVLTAVAACFVPGGDYVRALIEAGAKARAALAGVDGERIGLLAERDQLSARVSDLVLKGQIALPGWSEGMRIIGTRLETVDRRLAELQGIEAAGKVDAASVEVTVDAMHQAGANLAKLPPEQQANALRQVVRRVTVSDSAVTLDMFQPDAALASGRFVQCPQRVLPALPLTNTIRVVFARASQRGPRVHRRRIASVPVAVRSAGRDLQ